MKHLLILTAFFLFNSISVISQTGSKEVFTYVEQMPEFPGGQEALMNFLMNNIKYPDSAKEYGVAGKVYAKFVVNPDGKVSDIEIIKGIGMGCDQEVIRVLSIMPSWNPGKQNGKAVSVYFTLPVSFYLYSNDDTPPGFVGGETAWQKFIADNSALKLSDESNAKHEVIIKLEVDKNGSVSKLSIDKSAGKTFDDEAVRLIQSVEKWNAATKNGKSADGTALLHFYFK